jgi:hypothetical protein
MFAIIGILIVIGAIIGGYLMEHGKLMVLVQPAELLIIGGAAVGTILVANPLNVIIRVWSTLGDVPSQSRKCHRCLRLLHLGNRDLPDPVCLCRHRDRLAANSALQRNRPSNCRLDSAAVP